MDPRVAGQKSANHSPLMERLQRASLGEKVNFCPFGCKEHELDELGLCDHLVGYTDDGRTMEPVEKVRGRRVVQLPQGPDGRPRRVPVPPGSRLERITVSARVYHQGAEPQKKSEALKKEA